MRVGVTTGAIQVFPVIDHGWLGLELGRFLMAIGARHSHVTARQNKPGLLMPGQRKGRRLVSIQGVALIAGIEIRRGRELRSVLIGVAIGAAIKFDFEQRVLPFRDVALVTFHMRVPSLQGISTGGVILDRECGRFETLHGMARRAFDSARSLHKLTIVRIGMVTVGALGECHRFLEISVRVALRTINRRVFAFQRIFRLGVIEAFVHGLQRNLLPPRGAMTGRTSLRETPVVRILVAVGALVEGDTHVLRLTIGSVGMALRALHLSVQPSQRIPGLRVIELSDLQRLPVLEVMTLQTILAETAFVLIFMAGDACRRHSQIAAIEVFVFDRRAFLRRNVGGAMTLVAGQTLVLALQKVARLLVIESFRVPLDQRKIFAVVFGVAPGTFLA